MDARSLARAEARNDVGATVGNEAAEILANIDAMQLAVEEATEIERLTPQHLEEIHGALLKGAPRSAGAGTIRDEQNWIGGNDYNPCEADFVPPPPEELDATARRPVRLLQRRRAAAARPGRTGACPVRDDPPVRSTATAAPAEQWCRCCSGAAVSLRATYPRSASMLAAERDRYISGLVHYRQGELTGWVEQFAVAAARAAHLARAYLSRVRALQHRWREQLRALPSPPRSDAVAWRLIDVLPAHPIITLPVGVAATGRSKPQVNAGLDQLVTAGVLAPLSRSARNRSWEADGLLDLLKGLEDGR